MTLSVDVSMLKDSRGRRWDLTSPADRQWILDNGFEMDLPVNDRISGHPLVVYFSDFTSLFAMHQDKWDEMTKPSLVFNFFIPTSGWLEVDSYGRFSPNWRLREQQVDFLLSYFEHWEHLNQYNLVIGFCDESPVLDEIIEQIYDCMNLYHIPKDQVKLMGHNFSAQKDINDFCLERKENPIKYVIRWHMSGHMDYKRQERIADRDKLTDELTYNEAGVTFKYTRQYPISFLNRRPSMSRACLLWGLYVNGITAKKIPTISAFPPLKYHGAGKTDDKWEDRVITHDYMGHTLQKFQPELLSTLNNESLDDFKDKMRVGKSVPGDYEYIGAEESQNIPYENEFYVWLTCETTADIDKPNLFFTEKMLKPMVQGQGLLVFAQKHYLQRFKKLGFYTLGEEFDIDETYDDVDNDVERMKRVIQEAVKLCNTEPNVLYERWLSAKNKIRKNRMRIYSQLTNIKGNYTENLVKHLCSELEKPYDRDEILAFNINDELKKYRKFTNFNQFKDN